MSVVRACDLVVRHPTLSTASFDAYVFLREKPNLKFFRKKNKICRENGSFIQVNVVE